MVARIRLSFRLRRPKEGFRDLDEALDAAGVTREILTGHGTQLVSQESNWQPALKTCTWAAAILAQWPTDFPRKSSRHGWLQYNAVRLACMRRYGCLTAGDELTAMIALKERLEWLLEHTGVAREPHENEVIDCLRWGTETTEAKTDAEVLAELANHDHLTTDATTDALMDRWRTTAHDRKEQVPRTYVVKRASELTPTRVEYLWQDEIVLNSLALISGPQGEGKSTIATWLAAEVTVGGLEGALLHQPSEVVYLSFEEDPSTQILGRLYAMEADVHKVLFIMESPDEDELVNLVKSADVLEDVLTKNPKVRLVIVDPIIEALIGTNTDSEAEVRKHLKRLRRIAKKYGVTVILITHWNKKEQAGLRQRTMGSTAFSSVPRTNHAVVPDFEDSEHKRRYFGCYKENVSPEARYRRYPYRLVVQYLTHNGDEIEAPKLEWEPKEAGGIEDYYNQYTTHSKVVTVKSPDAEQTERDKMNEEIARLIKREIEQSDLTVEIGKHKGRKYVVSRQVQDLVINKGLIKGATAERYQRELIGKACSTHGIDKSRLGATGSFIYLVNEQYWKLLDSI